MVYPVWGLTPIPKAIKPWRDVPIIGKTQNILGRRHDIDCNLVYSQTAYRSTLCGIFSEPQGSRGFRLRGNLNYDVHIPSRPYSRCSRVRYQEIRDIALHPSKRPCYSAPRDFGLHVSPSLGFDTSKLSCKHGLVWVKLNFCPCRIKNLVQSPLQSNLYGSIAGSDSGMAECFKSSEGGRNEPSRVPIQTNVSRPRGGHS